MVEAGSVVKAVGTAVEASAAATDFVGVTAAGATAAEA
jgi:hypothetical protein